MNVREYMRRYEAMPEGFRAELINGVVYVNRWVEKGPDGQERLMAPISGGSHGIQQGMVCNLLGTYMIHSPHLVFLAPTTMILPGVQAAPEPDAILYIRPDAGGNADIGADGYLHGAPELVVEIAGTTAANDLGPKMEMYAQHGVSEYLVWRTREGIIDLFHLSRAKRYNSIVPGADGVLRSRTFPGLWFDTEALTATDLKRAVQTLQNGLASPEHTRFVEKLNLRASRKRN